MSIPRSPTDKTRQTRQTRLKQPEGQTEASDSSRARSLEDVSKEPGKKTEGEELKIFISQQMAGLKKEIKEEIKDIKEEINQMNSQMDTQLNQMKNQLKQLQHETKLNIEIKVKKVTDDLKEEFIEMFDDMEKKMDEKLEKLKKDFHNRINPIEEVQEQQMAGIKNLEQIAKTSALTTAKLITENERLMNMLTKTTEKCTELEGHQRRQNLRIAGIREGREKNDGPREFTAKLLKEVLSLEEMPLLARAHRVSRRQTKPNAPPRQMILKVQHDFVLDEIMRKASRIKDLTFEGQRISIYRDYPPEVAMKRKAFNEAKSLMRGVENLRYGLNYPAILRVSYNNAEHFFKTPAAALEFAQQLKT